MTYQELEKYKALFESMPLDELRELTNESTKIISEREDELNVSNKDTATEVFANHNSKLKPIEFEITAKVKCIVSLGYDFGKNKNHNQQYSFDYDHDAIKKHPDVKAQIAVMSKAIRSFENDLPGNVDFFESERRNPYTKSIREHLLDFFFKENFVGVRYIDKERFK